MCRGTCHTSEKKMRATQHRSRSPAITFRQSLITLAYTSTYFKIIGQTIERLALDISSYDERHIGSLGITNLLVGISRVRDPNTQLRLLPVSPQREIATRHHLAALRPPRNLHSWLKHFEPIDENSRIRKWKSPSSLENYSVDDRNEHDRLFRKPTNN